MDNTLRDLLNSSNPTKVEFMNCFIIHSKQGWEGEGNSIVFHLSFLTFRAEKRFAQASAHPLSQAQGGLFCVLIVFVCCWSSE